MKSSRLFKSLLKPTGVNLQKIKKNIELNVKNNKLDKAFLELEKVTDIMED